MSVLIFFLAGMMVTTAAPAKPLAGPMLGPVTSHSAIIWVQGREPAKIALEIETPETKPAHWRTPVLQLEQSSNHTAKFQLNELTPGTRYRYKLIWNGTRLDTLYHFTTLPANGSAGTEFTVYLGSCAHLHDPETDNGNPWSGGYEIFDRIAAESAAITHPQLMIWLGDNTYLRPVDYEHPSRMARRYQRTRSHPVLQKLLASVPHYAIWDDHDYGPNDHNRSFVFKQASLELFQLYWPNPSAGLPGVPGVFTQFSIADADFFLLDNRWYRDSDRDQSANKTLFGPDQMRWLKNALMASRARFKIVAGGSQFFNDLSRYEGWQHFPEERADFLAWLELNKISGLIFLSGDRHRTELLKHERSGNYPLYELTCSPLTSGLHRTETVESEHPSRVAGTLVEARNYCTISAHGQGDKRSLTLRSHDALGNPFWEIVLDANSLKQAGKSASQP